MSRFKGIYWRTFTVTVGMVALTLVLQIGRAHV